MAAGRCLQNFSSTLIAFLQLPPKPYGGPLPCCGQKKKDESSGGSFHVKHFVTPSRPVSLSEYINYARYEIQDRWFDAPDFLDSYILTPLILIFMYIIDNTIIRDIIIVNKRQPPSNFHLKLPFLLVMTIHFYCLGIVLLYFPV